jgi:hypothetical protein
MSNGITRNSGFFLLMIAVLALLGVALIRYFETAEGQIMQSPAATQESKRDYTKLIHESIGGVLDSNVDGKMSVDILTPSRAIEVVWQEDSLTGVGRAMYLGTQTNRPPLVILLSRDGNWFGQYKKVEACGVECWVYSTDNKMFIKGGMGITWTP